MVPEATPPAVEGAGPPLFLLYLQSHILVCRAPSPVVTARGGPAVLWLLCRGIRLAGLVRLREPEAKPL